MQLCNFIDVFLARHVIKQCAVTSAVIEWDWY